MEQVKPNILVTGASGFIGQTLCKKLLEENYWVRSLVRADSTTVTTESGSAAIENISGDLLDRESLLQACKGVDVVIHLAGIAHVNNVPDSQYQRVIFEGSRNLIDACIENGVSRIIYLSSALAIAAETDRKQATSYGRAKLQAEQYLEGACQESDTDYVILRPVNVYGKNMKGNITNMIRWIKRGILPPLPRVATEISLISVEDLTDYIVLAIEHPKAKNNCFVISESIPYKLLEIEKQIYLALEKKIPTRHSPHVLLYAAAATAGLVGKLLKFLRIKSPLNSISLRTYNNMLSDSVFQGEEAVSALGFTPKENFFSQLPAIISNQTQT